MIRKTPQVAGARMRHGFTLSEMLVVLGILVGITALAQPAIRSTLCDSRLRSAAQNICAELSKARLKAMQSGTAQRFRYQQGTNRFEVAALANNKLADEQAATRQRERTIAAARAAESTAPVAEADPVLELPSGVCFAEMSTEPGADVAMGEDGWSDPVVFYPNGRTGDARIKIKGERNAVIEVSLRGLTGVATASKTRREEEVR